MNKERMKSLLIRDKVFLRELCNDEDFLKKKRILNAANDTQINTLIWFLHYLSTGEIRMKKSHFDEIANSKITLIKHKVESKRNLTILLNSNRSTKLSFLNKLAAYFTYLLYPLFNES
jgi:hypothetical protein